MRKTSRGFRIYSEFTDLYGTRIKVQESSLATKKAVWIFRSNPNDGQPVAGSDKPSCMDPHLSVAQAKRLIRALQIWLKEVADFEADAEERPAP